MANLDIFEREGLNDHVKENAPAFRATLEKLLDLPIVGDVRGAGYFYGIELVKDKETRETFNDAESERLLRGYLSKALFDAGLYCRADDRGDPVIQLAPPLIIGQPEFDDIEQRLRSVLTGALEAPLSPHALMCVRPGASGEDGPRERRRTPRPPAPQAHRGRASHARGAHLLAPGQPVHAAPGRVVGRAPGRLGDPRGGRGPARLLAGRAVRPRGAADRRDRARHRGGDRGARRRAPRPQRAGPRGVAARHGRLAVAGGRGGRRQRAVLLGRRGLVPGEPARRRPASPSSGRSSPTRGARPSTTSGGWSTPPTPPSPPPGSCPAARGGWPPTGPTTPTRCARCSTPSRPWRAAGWSGGPSGR